VSFIKSRRRINVLRDESMDWRTRQNKLSVEPDYSS